MKDKAIISYLIGILLLIGILAILILCDLSSITQNEITISELQSEQVYQRQILDKSEAYIQDLITYGDCYLCHDPIIRTINYARGE